MARYPMDLAWRQTCGWVYLAFLAALLLLGAAGWAGAERRRAAVSAPGPAGPAARGGRFDNPGDNH